MLVWHFEIRGARNRLVKRDGAFTIQEEALRIGTKFLQDHPEEPASGLPQRVIHRWNGTGLSWWQRLPHARNVGVKADHDSE